MNGTLAACAVALMVCLLFITPTIVVEINKRRVNCFMVSNSSEKVGKGISVLKTGDVYIIRIIYNLPEMGYCAFKDVDIRNPKRMEKVIHRLKEWGDNMTEIHTRIKVINDVHSTL